MSVFFDGEKLCVQLVRGKDYKKVLELAKQYDSEYIASVGIYVFPPIKKIAWALEEAGYPFDKSAEMFLQKKKEIEIPETLFPFQKEGVKQMLEMNTNILLADEMGCLDGKTEVQINRHKKSSVVTIAELYRKFHNENSYIKYSKEYRPWFIRCLHEDNVFRLGEIVDVLYAGKKHCIKLTFDDNRTLVLTKDHLLKTENNWIEAQNSLNCDIMCNGNSCCKKCGSTEDLITYQYSKFLGYCRKCMYAERKGKHWKDKEIHEVIRSDGYVYLEGYPLRNYKSGCLRTDGIPKHRFVMEQHFGRNLLPSEIVHHIDGNKLNNDISNLMLLNDIKAHRQFHNSYNHFKFVNPSFHKVIKIEDVGIRDTYDIKVLNHGNFLANKVVVHNCGKTVQAVVYLKLKRNSLPALIVCPASLKLNWSREIEKWTHYKTHIIDGRNPQQLTKEFINKYPVWIINYDILGSEDKKEKEKEMERRKRAKAMGYPCHKKQIKVNGWCDELIKHNFQTIICDEIQYIAEPETIRARAILQISKALQNSKKLFISGTPYETKTSQFFTCLSILDPVEFNNRYRFLMRYCDPVKTFFGWKFDGLSNAEELHAKISKFMIRRLKKDVLTQLPPKIRAVVPMQVTPAERKIYDEVDWQFEQDIINGVKDKKEQLGHIAQLKQASYRAKEKAVIKWIKDYLTFQNKKLVVFIYHKATYEALMKEFGYCSVGLTGATPPNQRQAIVDKFQNEDKVFLFIGQIKASGVGLTLTKASATCFVEFGSTAPQHEQAEDRVHRIGQTADSVMAYYLILENSIEQDIMNTLERRNKDLKKVMNNEDNASLFNADDMQEAILAEYKKRKNIKK